MTPPDTQCIRGHQTLEMNLLFHTFAFFQGFIGFQRANQPHHAIDLLDAKVPRALRHIATKSNPIARCTALDWCRQQGHHASIIPVKYHQCRLTKDAGLGAGVILHRTMPVQMVLGDVQHRSSCWLEPVRLIKLEAGQLNDPHLWQFVIVQSIGEGVEQCRANIACYGNRLTRPADQLTGQRGNRSFAIRTCNRQNLRVVAV